MSSTDPPPQTRFCPTCRTEKPLDQFRRRVPGTEQRHRVCNKCHAAAERLRRGAAKHHAREEALGVFVSRVAYAREPAVVGAILRHVLDQFGSADQFVAAAVGHFQTLRECHPTSRTLGNYYIAFTHLWRYYDECRPTNDFTDMDDEELEQFIVHKVLRRLEANPAIAVDFFTELGWQIAPPATT